MAVSVVESVDGTSGTLGTTPSVTIATTPTTGDILIVVIQHTSAISSSTVTGCGATWSTLQATDTAGNLDHHIFVGTGATSAGTITITCGTSRTGLVRALVVRGANSSTVTASTNTATASTGQTVTSNTVTSSPNQAVICIMGSSAGTNTLFSSTTPSSGWTLDTANGTWVLQSGIHNAASSGESDNCSATCVSGTSRQFRFTMLTVGDVTSSGATVALPALAVTTAAPAPSLAVGSTVALPVQAVSLAAPAPSVVGGAAIPLPAVALTTATPAPSVTTDAAVALPVVDVDLAVPPPTPTGAAGGSASLALPVLPLTVATPAPTISADWTVSLPVITATITAPAPTVATGAAGDATVNLPPITVTVGAYTFTTATSVTVGLPPIKGGVKAPPPVYGNRYPVDRIHVSLFDETGLTEIEPLVHARGMSWQEGINIPGSANFEIPLDDAANITDGKIVKLSWYRGSSIDDPNPTRIADFACRVQGETMEYAVDGRRWLSFQNQPGVMSLLADGVVFPEYGYDGTGVEKRQVAADRHFGFMSSQYGAFAAETPGFWYKSADWVTPGTTAWGSGYHKKQPADFKSFDATAEWCSYGSPEDTVAASAAVYGRTPFTVTEDMDVQIVCALDDWGSLYLDGQELISADPMTHQSWTQAQVVTTRITAGVHLLAVMAHNAPGIAGHHNPVAFIYSVRKLDAKGNPTGGVIAHSAADSTLVHADSPEPGWTRAGIALRLFGEANTLATSLSTASGIVHLQHGWDDQFDTDGVPWTDLQALSFPIGTVNLLDVFTQLGEQGFDMRVDPTTMTLKLYKRLGSDLTGIVVLKTRDVGGNLESYSLTSAAVQYTAILTQVGTGQFAFTKNDDAVAAHGLIMNGATVGSVDTLKSAAPVAVKLLDEAAHPLATATAVCNLHTGPLPYLDFDIGDTVNTPGRRNVGVLPMRTMTFTVDGSGDVLKVTAELTEDRS